MSTTVEERSAATCVSTETANAVAALASIANSRAYPLDFLPYGESDVVGGLSQTLYTLTQRTVPIDPKYLSWLSRHYGAAAVQALYALPEAIERGMAPEFAPYKGQLAWINDGGNDQITPTASTMPPTQAETINPPTATAPGAHPHTRQKGVGTIARYGLGGLILIVGSFLLGRALR